MKRSRASKRILILLAIAVLFVLLGIIGALGPMRSAGAWAARPFSSLTSKVGGGIAGGWEVVTSAGRLSGENQRLRSEVASLRQRLSEDAELRAQNDQLRAQLGVGQVRPDSLVAAEVIGYQPDNFRQFITISRGSSDGLKEGMAVVSQGTLVGTIQDVTPSSAKVFLVIDPNFRVTGLDQDAASRPTGTVHGQIGSGLIMDKIAQNETINPGDTVVTSGSGNNIPKGLIIGRIQTVDKKDNGVFQTAQVTSDVQFNRLEIVYVVVRP